MKKQAINYRKKIIYKCHIQNRKISLIFGKTEYFQNQLIPLSKNQRRIAQF